MDLRVNQPQAPSQVQPNAPVTPTDGSFKFTLISSIEESELAEKLTY